MDHKGVELARGIVERIGSGSARFTQRVNGETRRIDVDVIDHHGAFQVIGRALTGGIITNLEEIKVVGHRVVHGGDRVFKPTRVDSDLVRLIREMAKLAPLHNPANLLGIEAATELLPKALHVAVFDTAFHQTLPPRAYLYAIPYELYERYRVRRYGFHGTSHHYVARRAAQLVGKPLEELRMVTCHLGNGCSLAAIKRGRCIDTSMGFTPLEGLVMGTRSGDIDPSVIFYLADQGLGEPRELYRLLNQESGLLGLSGVSNDMREVKKAADEGNPRAKLAIEVYAYRIKKYIGAYAAALGGLDVIAFTAGVGENAPFVRAAALEGLEFLGIRLDPEANDRTIGVEGVISSPDSKVKVLVVPTNEELMIALEAFELYRQPAGYR
jgi:acetate kinase